MTRPTIKYGARRVHLCVCVIIFLRKPSLLIEKGERGPTSRLQTDKRTHTAPHIRTPPPRLGRRETRGWSSPKEGVQTRMEE